MNDWSTDVCQCGKWDEDFFFFFKFWVWHFLHIWTYKKAWQNQQWTENNCGKYIMCATESLSCICFSSGYMRVQPKVDKAGIWAHLHLTSEIYGHSWFYNLLLSIEINLTGNLCFLFFLMGHVLNFHLSCLYFLCFASTHRCLKKSLTLVIFPHFENCPGHMQVLGVYYHPYPKCRQPWMK